MKNNKTMMQKINRKHYSILFLLVVFISSCKVGKEYQRPELELPQQFSDSKLCRYQQHCGYSNGKNFLPIPPCRD